MIELSEDEYIRYKTILRNSDLPKEYESCFEEINKEGTTILLVEKNAQMALSVANRGYVLQTGQIVLDDTADNLRENEMVQKAYLGIE